MRKPPLRILLPLLLVAAPLCAAPPLLSQAPSLAERLELALPELMQRAGIPGLSIALTSHGEQAWSGAFGVKSLDTNEPIDGATVFEAASLSKPVFAYAVLRLVERGELDLDESLAESLPNERMSHDDRYLAITPRMVLSHSSGLPNWGGERLELNFDPGSSFNYSGEGFVYLQKVVEKRTGLTLDELAQREVFEPLGMKRSSYVWREDFEDNCSARHDSAGHASALSQDTEGNAAASLLTTAEDYARFLSAVFRGKGLEKETRAAMLRPERSLAGASWGDDEEAKEQLSWGLGWGLQASGEDLAFWHWGDNGSAKAFTMVDIETGEGFVYFANSVSGLAIAEALVDLVFSLPSPALRFLDYEQHDDPVRLARLSLIETFRDKGVEQGQTTYRRLRASEPDVATEDLLREVGFELLGSGEAEAAIGVFQLATEDHPTSARAHEALGEAHLRAGSYAPATASYRKAVSLDPENESLPAKLTWAEDRLRAEQSPVEVPVETLRRFAGDYGPRHVVLEGETLYYRRDDNPKRRLVPLTSNLFAVDGLEAFRIRFVEDEEGRVARIVGLYLDGNEDESPRDP